MADTTTKTITATLGTGYPVRGEKGDKGDSGFSPTAKVTQTDTGATISITDASGTTTADITNGSDGWELINTITVSEASMRVKITTDSNGNAFALSKVLVLFSFTSVITDYLDILMDNDGYVYYYNTPALSGHCYAFMTKDGWCIATSGFNKDVSLGSASNRFIVSGGPRKLSSNYIKLVSLQHSYLSSDVIPAGSVITIYGVRA